jgi:LmbE family N-acetylglucosaminyl deacetylase
MRSSKPIGKLLAVAERYRAIFISPHLDDAVFSCAGEIDRVVQEGPVLVLNLFTRHLGDVKIRSVVLGDERDAEEAEAAQFLRFESHNMGELDAVFRRDPYHTLGNLFRPPIAEDLAWLPELRRKVFDFLAGLDYECLYVPLGIGWHVDHVLTHLVFEPWRARANLTYYEDTPYCLIPNATRYRLNELGVCSRDEQDLSLKPGNELRAWWQTAMGYADTALMRNLKPWIVRQLAVPAVAFYLYRLMAQHRRQAILRPMQPWVAHVCSLEGRLEHKIEAMALYESQFREFFGSRDDCRRSLLAYAMRVVGRASVLERFWQPGPPAYDR